MHKIADNLTQVQNSIQAAAASAGRNPQGITLLAVSKGQPAAALAEAFAWGQRDFGENYLQEAQAKMAELAGLPIVWHFIGPLQNNKAASVAKQFSWLHSLASVKLAERLSAARPGHLPPLNVCLQVNIDEQPTKAGCSLAEAPLLAAAIARLPGLKLRGLMALPDPLHSPSAFADLRELLLTINDQLDLALDTLSMGMSGDMPDAIAQGSTLVRIGTAIFGARA